MKTIVHHNTFEYRGQGKEIFGEGPWQDEPDKMQWLDEATGLPCLIVRGPMGALCGYVGVPKGHKAYGKFYEEIDVDVHGGLTYSDRCSSHICHEVEEGEDDDIWWLGFDCGHFMDIIPGVRSALESIRKRGEKILYDYEVDGFKYKYRDIAYVQNECRSLAEQLKRMA